MPVPRPDAPILVVVSEEEKENGRLTPHNLLTSIVALAEDGLVVLRDAIDVEHVDAINEIMLRDMDDAIKRKTTHVNSEGNINQVPPLTEELFYEDIYANVLAGQVLESVLGPRPALRYVNSNMLLPGGIRQVVHTDISWRYPHILFSLTINIYLVDADEANGSTEVWLGTHRDANRADHPPGSNGIIPELLDARRAVRPSIRLNGRKGDLVIRDPRLWHAGMPNLTDHPRPMLGPGYSAEWMDNRLLLELPEECRVVVDKFQGPIVVAADYIDVPKGSFDYLATKFSYDFSPWAGRSDEEKRVCEQEWDEQWKGHF